MSSRFIALVILVLTQTGRSEAQMSVGVNFELDLPAMATLWDEGLPEASAAHLRQYLVGHLSETFKFWRFVEADSELPARLEFRLVEGGPNEALLELRLAGQGQADREISVVLWDPLVFGVEIGKKRAVITRHLSDELVRRLIKPQRRTIENWLKARVPIGREGFWGESSNPDRPPYLLLPLRRDLRLSRFRLPCSWAEGSPQVHTVGTGADRISGRPENLLVTQSPRVLVTLPSHLDYAGRRVDVRGPTVETPVGKLELTQLKPQNVFLEDYVPASDLFRIDESRVAR